MAFESKRFCFNLNCNKTEDDYKDENIKKEKIKLQLCSNCKIAEFCGKTCQEQAWKEGHKKWCLSINNPKKNHYLYQDQKYRVPKGRSGKPAVVIMDSRNCYLMSVHFKSYRGVELILSQYLNQILLGEPHLTKRYILNKKFFSKLSSRYMMKVQQLETNGNVAVLHTLLLGHSLKRDRHYK